MARTLSRRQLLAGAGAIGLGGLLLQSTAGRAQVTAANRHQVWVWQFSIDGEPNVLGQRLQSDGLGIVVKTHDGLNWMSDYDVSPYAVSGPAQVRVLANYFERAGIPFHAWCVVRGTNPRLEAQMAASVLEAGARSLYLDVEPHPGFWRGTPADALAFGAELRRLSPYGTVILCIDPRPWTLDGTPIMEFAGFSDAIAPQHYWSLFNSAANYERFADSGYPVPADGATPEFLLGLSSLTLQSFGLPVLPVGPGDSASKDDWTRFIRATHAGGGAFVGVWRYGITDDAVFAALRDNPPRQPLAPALLAGGVYIVQPGDTLSDIAEAYGVTVSALVQANGLTNPDYIYIGQELVVPGGRSGGALTTPSGAATGGTAHRRHVVQPGDSLYSIAGAFGTSVDAIAQLNGLADPNYIVGGQQLLIP